MAGRCMNSLWRKKTVSEDNNSQLNRCLSLLDLIGLGVGSTLGLGVYVLAGAVAREHSGPAVTVAFMVAALASTFAGLCYAEFAARVPRAGSAYVYSYVCIGELVAFLIGWNLILEYAIGTAGVAKGLSGYLDTLFDHKMQTTMHEVMPMNIPFLAKYPDFFAFGTVMAITTLLSFGVRESTLVNNLFTVLNICVILIVIIGGSFKADPANWSIKKEDIPEKYKNVAGEGGFFPFGFAGMMAGAAKCFFGFVGFDCIATTGEEAKNPKRNIPLSIIFSLIIIFLGYFGISTVSTMVWPYYDQDKDAPLPYIFEAVGWHEVRWIVIIGAVFALCTSMLGAMFPLPRVLYAMASDGVIFKFLSRVHPKTQTPLLATMLAGLLTAIISAIFDLDQLINMMSIGTLMAYTIVAVSVLVLRYQNPESVTYQYPAVTQITSVETNLLGKLVNALKVYFNLLNIKTPTDTSASIVSWGIVIFSIFAAGFCAIIIWGIEPLVSGDPALVIIISLIVLGMLIVLTSIARQPLSPVELNFKVPLVPWVPALSVLINIYLMLVLDYETWIRFAVWLLIGFAIYGFYGWRNSTEAILEKERQMKLSESKRTLVLNGPGDSTKL